MGVPHVKSRVMARERSPSFNHDCVIWMPFEDHLPKRIKHCPKLVSHLSSEHKSFPFSYDINRSCNIIPSTLVSSTHAFTFGCNLSRSKNICCDSRMTGRFPSSMQRGLINSVAFRIFPHLSHWSPLASYVNKTWYQLDWFKIHSNSVNCATNLKIMLKIILTVDLQFGHSPST